MLTDTVSTSTFVLLRVWAGTLTGRVPTTKLALSSTECQRGWPVDVESVRWLRSEDGQRVLDRAGALDDPDPLRARAVDKFGELAGSMYFTPDGLEQATRLTVATHRAARLGVFGAATVLDLGCGIGGDLVAFARAGLTAAGLVWYAAARRRTAAV